MVLRRRGVIAKRAKLLAHLFTSGMAPRLLEARLEVLMYAHPQAHPGSSAAQRAAGADRDDSGSASDARSIQPAWDPAKVVLVVDDESGIVESLTKIFQREGLHVLAATDGAAGLELL